MWGYSHSIGDAEYLHILDSYIKGVLLNFFKNKKKNKKSEFFFKQPRVLKLFIKVQKLLIKDIKLSISQFFFFLKKKKA
jgi:hypothetical protein